VRELCNPEPLAGRGSRRRVRGPRAMAIVVLVTGALLAAAGCGGSSNSGGSSGGSGGGSLHLQHAGQLTVGAEFPVKGFVQLPLSHPSGYEVDVADAVAKQLGVKTVKWVNVPFASLFSPAPKNFDFAINEITITPQRAQVVDFSDPYFDANQGFLVHRGTPAEQATSEPKMRSLQFGFQATTTGGDYIKNTIKPSKQPREYTSLGAPVQALLNKQIDAFVMDVAIDAQIVRQSPSQLVLPCQFITNEKYGILFEKGNSLRTAVNRALAALKTDGTLKRLRAKWFPGTQKLPTCGK
jgi:polar amino acid transport system substrate-binding protein